MSKTYATVRDFIEWELATICGLPDDFDHYVLAQQAAAAGLILYDDGYSDDHQSFNLDRAGFIWADPEGVEDPESPEWAKLWGLIETMLEETPGA